MKIIALQSLRGWMIYPNELLSCTAFLYCIAVIRYLALYNLLTDHTSFSDVCCVLMDPFINEP